MKKTIRRRNKVKLRKKKSIKGGVTDYNSVFVYGTMLKYGVAAVILGPLYLMAEALNAPITSINNFSRKTFNKTKPNWLHRPLYKVLAMSPEKKINEKDFLLQQDMHIHQNVAVVSLDKDPEDKDGTKEQPESKVKDFSPSGYDSFLNIFGQLKEKKKLRLSVYKLFQYIENIRATDEERKEDIQKLINNIRDYKTMIKCYLIYKTLNEKCPNIKKEEKTILKDEDVITMVNPFYNPCWISYTKRLDCIKRHLTQKRFNPKDEEDKKCRVSCDTCTFRNSITRLANKYVSSGAWIAALALIVSGVASIPAIVGIATPSASAIGTGIATGATMTASATTMVAGKNMATITAGLSNSGFGSILSSAGQTINTIMNAPALAKSLTTGSTRVLIGSAALLSMIPPDYSSIVKDMMNAYFKNIVIHNKEVITGVEGLSRLNEYKYKKYNNIIDLLDNLVIKTELEGKIDEDDKEIVLEKFNRFMCKYDIQTLVKEKLKKLYTEEEKKYTPYTLLKFMLNDSKQ